MINDLLWFIPWLILIMDIFQYSILHIPSQSSIFKNFPEHYLDSLHGLLTMTLDQYFPVLALHMWGGRTVPRERSFILSTIWRNEMNAWACVLWYPHVNHWWKTGCDLTNQRVRGLSLLIIFPPPHKMSSNDIFITNLKFKELVPLPPIMIWWVHWLASKVI